MIIYLHHSYKRIAVGVVHSSQKFLLFNKKKFSSLLDMEVLNFLGITSQQQKRKPW